MKRADQRYASLKVEGKFVNPFGEWREVQWWETALFWLLRYKGNGVPKSAKELDETMPVVKPSFDIMFPSAKMTESWVNVNRVSDSNDGSLSSMPPVAFTWLGQSTCLIRVENLVILTDPVFTRCTVNDHLGPKRLRPIPCTLEEIQPYLDIVLVSHDHFDHLDQQVVMKLGNAVTWYVPLGLRQWFVKRGIENVIELDWWQEVHHNGDHDTMVACVPAMHWSGHRTLFDKNTTLWGSFVVKTKSHSIFFCGDTGYSPELYKAIGERYAPFSLAAMPIGSFKPEVLMEHLHMGPSDAVKVHYDIGRPRISVGIHWGTFIMSDEHYMEPVKQLKEAWKQIGIEKASVVDQDNTRFITTSIGETI